MLSTYISKKHEKSILKKFKNHVLPFQCVKINPIVKILLSYWSKSKSGLILMSCPSMGPKILDCPNDFGPVPIFFDRSNSFWSGPNNFGQVQIITISPEKSNLNLTILTKMIWNRPKQFGPNQNNLHPSKKIWAVQNQALTK